MKNFREYVQYKEELLCESVKSKILSCILKSFLITTLVSAAYAGWDTWHSQKAEAAVESAIKERILNGGPNVTIPDLIETGKQAIDGVEEEFETEEAPNDYDYSKGDIADKAGNFAGLCFKNFMSKYSTRFKLANDLYNYLNGVSDTQTEDILDKIKEIEKDLASKKTFKEIIEKMKTPEGRSELKDTAKEKGKDFTTQGTKKFKSGLQKLPEKKKIIFSKIHRNYR